jgi:hypothetical protein
MTTVTLQHVVGTAMTTAILFCGAPVTDQGNFSITLPSEDSSSRKSIDYGLSFDRYQILNNDEIAQQNDIEVIHGFASNLLENIRDLPPEYSELVDANFWDLI